MDTTAINSPLTETRRLQAIWVAAFCTWSACPSGENKEASTLAHRAYKAEQERAFAKLGVGSEQQGQSFSLLQRAAQ